jgi:ribosome-associated protein
VKLNKAESLELARLCCRALNEKKAGDLRVIDVTEVSSITNYIIVATATSEPHVRALRVELEIALDTAKAHIIGTETASESGWAVMDAFDVMVHIFTPEMRTRYKLEHLWKDGDELDIYELLGEKRPPSKKKVKSVAAAHAVKKAPAKAKALKKKPLVKKKPARK